MQHETSPDKISQFVPSSQTSRMIMDKYGYNGVPKCSFKLDASNQFLNLYVRLCFFNTPTSTST